MFKIVMLKSIQRPDCGIKYRAILFTMALQAVWQGWTFIVPVAAVEGGFNAIPDAMAPVLAAEFYLQMALYHLSLSNYFAPTQAKG